MQANELLIPLAAAFGVTAFATPLVARLARSLGVVDRPSDRSVSRREDMPLLGGLAVCLGFLIGLALALRFFVDGPGLPRQFEGLFYGGALVLIAGIYDDRFGLNAWSKFAIQGAAAMIALGYGYQIGHVSEPISRTSIMLPEWISWPLTALWIIGITNAMNLIDGLDGLAAGVGAIIAVTLTIIAFQTGQMLSLCLGLALTGSLLGFLPFNFHPAKIFLGDTGSMLIGYLLALLTLEGYRQLSLITFIVPLLALAVPILDTVLSIFRRVRQRAPVFTADRQHMHHRLLAAEGTQRAAVLHFYFLTAAFCLIALSFTKLQGQAAALFLLAVLVLTLRLLWNLGVLTTETSGEEEEGHPIAAEEERS